MIHTAEGEHFRDVLVRAELERLLVEFGRKLGPPWRQDEKVASLAGLVALGLA